MFVSKLCILTMVFLLLDVPWYYIILCHVSAFLHIYYSPEVSIAVLEYLGRNASGSSLNSANRKEITEILV